MRIAMVEGDGICGITSSPAYYPVMAGSGPCSAEINPCGEFQCNPTPDGTSNTCSCNTPSFIAVNNLDGSQSCAPVAVCTFFLLNPCGPGTCINDRRGSYTCICPSGLEIGSRTDGSPTCVPSSMGLATTYTAQEGDSCYLIHTTFGLTYDAFMAQNEVRTLHSISTRLW